MSRPGLLSAFLAAAAAIAVLAGCGGKIDVPKSDTAVHHGAVLFSERCSGCHTLGAANSRGSRAPGNVKGGERTDGPNFDVRKENRDDVLFAIRNGGFSGSIMPANVVVGKDAEEVARFVERYAGRKAPIQGGSSVSKGGNQ